MSAFFKVSNIVSGDLALPTGGNSQIGWLSVPAPLQGRITRIAVVQTTGTVENVACLVDIYNSLNAIGAGSDAIFQYQVAPQTTVAGNAGHAIVFLSQSYSNNDGGNNIQPNSMLYIRVNSQSNTAKTYRIILTIET